MEAELPEQYIKGLVGKQVVVRIRGGRNYEERGLLLAFVTDHIHRKQISRSGHLVVLPDNDPGQPFAVTIDRVPYVAPFREKERGQPTMTFKLEDGGEVVIVAPKLPGE